MAVCGLDASVQTVDDEFCSLISADLPSGINSLRLGFIVATGAKGSVALDIPATAGIVNNMMRRTCHNSVTPYAP